MRVSHRQRPLILHVPLVLALLVLAVPVRSASPPGLSGLDLLDLCVGAEPGSGSPCHAYFEDVMHGIDGRLRPGQRGACPPATFNAGKALAMFRSEARIYPEVLHVPASDLIEGMLLKFFPCRGA